MFHYEYVKLYNLDKLTVEIASANIPMISMDLHSDTHFTVNTATALNNTQIAALNQVVASHTVLTDMLTIVQNKILAARNFGTRLIAQYGATNVLSGYSIEQIQDIMIRTQKVQSALNTGSLYVAINELNLIETDESIITEAKIKNFRNQIEDYLQIPRT